MRNIIIRLAAGAAITGALTTAVLAAPAGSLYAATLATATTGTDEMKSFILKTDMTADEIKARLGEGCKASEGCVVEQISEGVFKLVIPAALMDELGQSKGGGGVDKQLQAMIGGDSVVSKNRMTGLGPVKTSTKTLKIKAIKKK